MSTQWQLLFIGLDIYDEQFDRTRSTVLELSTPYTDLDLSHSPPQKFHVNSAC